jgi:hypothetical protein
MPAANVIQLRQLLAERFPGVRTRLDDAPAPMPDAWPTGVAALDERLRGGLSRSVLTEVVAAQPGSGSATLLHALVRNAIAENKLVALVDGRDMFDVTAAAGGLSRLLWVRCRAAAEAVKAADLLLRDGNVPLVLLDLAANTSAELRRIQPTTWYRFQRIIEQTAAMCVVFTPRAMVSAAQARLTLSSRFELDALERDAEDLLVELKVEPSETRGARDPVRALHSA